MRAGEPPEVTERAAAPPARLPRDGGPDLVWRASFAVDPLLTLAIHRRGRGDPTLRVDSSGAIWRTCLTPAGPGTLRLITAAPDRQPGTAVRASAWGPGASWLLAALPDLLGAQDDPGAFRPAHPVLRGLVRRYSGLRLSRTGRVFEALVPAVLEQKVVGKEARVAWRRLLTGFGGPAPGPAPAGMRVFPAPRTWQAISSWDWHLAGVEGIRAATIAGAAAVAPRLEEICTMPGPAADARLRSLPGIGAWTAAEIRQRACGDADAVSVGDYHLPVQVGWALTGEPTDDAGMLDLLAQYQGQRYRAARLIELSGLGPPRQGPRRAARDYRGL